jgi:hypothetical protein
MTHFWRVLNANKKANFTGTCGAFRCTTLRIPRRRLFSCAIFDRSLLDHFFLPCDLLL